MPDPASRSGRPLALAFALLVFTAGAASLAAQDSEPRFPDPAPPVVHELEPMTPPTAAEHPDLEPGEAPRALAEDAVTEDWTGFLGPARDGRSRETRTLTTWPAGGPTRVWSIRRGDGYSGPAIQGERLCYTHREGDRVLIDCLEAATGRRFWRYSYETDYSGRYIKNNGPRATPQIDGDHVFVLGVEGKLHALDLATGRVVWRRDLTREFEIPGDFFGFVGSPLVVGDLLIINVGAPGGPCVAAFGKKNGRLVWGAGHLWGASCASPVLGALDGQPRVFVLAGGDSRPPVGGFLALDPATGAIETRYDFRSRIYESVTGSSPLVGPDWVFLTSAYGLGSAALSLRKGTPYFQLWRSRSIGLQFSNPVWDGEHIWLVDGHSDRPGAVVRLDPRSGEERARTDLNWDEKVARNGEEKTLSFSIGEGSLLKIEDGFLALGDNGHLLSLATTPDGTRVRSRTWLFRANESWTPLALSRGLLYVCQNKRERFGDAPARLLCYDLRANP